MPKPAPSLLLASGFLGGRMRGPTRLEAFTLSPVECRSPQARDPLRAPPPPCLGSRDTPPGLPGAGAPCRCRLTDRSHPVKAVKSRGPGEPHSL